MEGLCGHYRHPAPLCFRKLRCLATPAKVLVCPGICASRKRHGIHSASTSGLCDFPGLAPWACSLFGLSAGPARSYTDTSEKKTLPPPPSHTVCANTSGVRALSGMRFFSQAIEYARLTTPLLVLRPSPASSEHRKVLMLVNGKSFCFRARLTSPRITLKQPLADSRREQPWGLSCLSPGTHGHNWRRRLCASVAAQL